jgi:pimeloyl-ACP methyl ester carboxylesterase
MITLGLGTATQQMPDLRPDPRINNLWYQYRNTDRVIVFVHGLGDDSRHCWYHEASGSYWPDRVAASYGLSDYSIFLGGYYTDKVRSRDYGVADCANELFRALSLPGREKPVLEHKAILFVCHSLGGIVTRYMLESKAKEFQTQTIGLFLFASPSTGSKWADVMARIAGYLGMEPTAVLQTLATNSPLLDDLDGRFKNLVNDRTLHVFGKEACETLPFKHLGLIVNAESAGQYFGRVEKLAQTDHSTCVKPDSDRHPAHVTLISWINEFEKRFRATLPERKPSSMVCRRLQCSVRIANEDGDAEHEIAYLGISGVANGEHRLPGPKQGTGHPSEPRLNDARTDPSVKMHSDDRGYLLRFPLAPSVDATLNAVYALYTFVAFAMDARERALMGGKEPGVDYLQKSLDQDDIQELVMHVETHPNMLLSGLPYVEVRLPGGGDLDPQETARVARMLDYSPLLRAITLFVRDPMRERAYRICWKLADAPDAKKRPTDTELDRQQDLVEELLWLRNCQEVAQPSAAEKDAIQLANDSMSQIAGLVYNVIGKDQAERLDADQLECSLMVVDDRDEEKLAEVKIIVGTGISPGAWNLLRSVGDGNAGRCVKRRAIRFYDREKATEKPFDNIYKAAPGGRAHQWLMSIPLFSSQSLVYGVVNIGTFQKKGARALRHLQDEAKTKVLAEGFQQIILTMLDLVRSKYRKEIREYAAKSRPGSN